MAGDIHDSVQREEKGRDQRRDPEALVGSLLQREHAPDEERETGDG